MEILGYSIDTGVLPVGRFPVRLQRSNRGCGSQRLLLFIIDLENQSNDSSNEHAELKNSFPCNIHTCHPLSFTIGGKRSITPEKIEGNRLPGRYRQHQKQHITPFDRLQGKKRGVSCGNAVIRPAFEFIIKTEFFIMYRYQPWKASSASLNAPYAPASLPREASVNRAPLAAWNTYLRK